MNLALSMVWDAATEHLTPPHMDKNTFVSGTLDTLYNVFIVTIHVQNYVHVHVHVYTCVRVVVIIGMSVSKSTCIYS